MTPQLAGFFGLGGPEIAALLVLYILIAVILIAVPVLIVTRVVKVAGKSAAPSRYCPKCGRGLFQPPDAPFCGYCGTQLP
jgi:hypothetical protein